MHTNENPSIISDIEGILIACKQYRFSILFFLVFAVSLSVAIALILPVKYSAQSSFFSMGILNGQDNGIPSSLSSVSRRFGVNFGGESDPSILYTPILQSRHFARRIIPHKYLTDSGDSLSLLEILSAANEPSERRFEIAHKRFVSSYLRIKNKSESGVTTLSIISTDPVLAAGVANKCVTELNKYVLELSAKANSSQAIFIENRLSLVSVELSDQEDKVKEFRIANRNISNSPSLLLLESRLMRELEIVQQIFLTLKQQHELAQIEASKDLARIALLDKAVPPAFRISPHRSAIVLFAAFIGLILGLTQALVRYHYYSRNLNQP